MTIRQAQDLTQVTHRAATLNVEKLVIAGILRELPRPTRPRIFFAENVIDAIEGRSDASQLPDDGEVALIGHVGEVEGTEWERV